MARRRGVSAVPTAIGDLIPGILGKNPKNRNKLQQYLLWDIWEEVVGPQVAAQARPFKMQGTTLVLAVSNSVWTQELSYLQPQLLSRIHQHIEPHLITDIRCVLGK